MGGVLFDITGSYRAAFINGIAWNLLNGAIVWWLLTPPEPPPGSHERQPRDRFRLCLAAPRPSA